MTLESIEKLRELSTRCGCSFATKFRDAYNRSNEHYALRDACDEIEREIAARYMELPVDADGEPIHLGDLMLKSTGAPKASYGEVVGVSDDSVWFSERNGWSSNWSSLTRHHRRPTVEDVLQEVVAAYLDTPLDDSNEGEFFEKYADKLREAVRGE